MLPRPSSKISLASTPTPIRKLSRLSAHIGGPNIWLKEDYLTGFTLSGNKVRKLEYLLGDAIAKGCSDVITCGGIQSNHCRATAFACAQLGLRCHLILRNDSGFNNQSSGGQANHFLDFLAGAEIHLYEASDYQGNLSRYFSELENSIGETSGRKAYSIPTGGSNGLGVWGYIECVEEIKQQTADLDICPEVIVCASGSGGTQAGLTLGCHLHEIQTEVHAFAVCDSAEYFTNKVKEDITACASLSEQSDREIESLLSSLNINTNDDYIGPGYAKTQSEVYECIRDLATLEGVLLDPVYTGKAFFGMLSELKQKYFGDIQDILFIHTGGGFGVFPHAGFYSDDID